MPAFKIINHNSLKMEPSSVGEDVGKGTLSGTAAENVKVVPTFGQFSVSVIILKFSFPFTWPISSQDSFFAHEHKSM